MPTLTATEAPRRYQRSRHSAVLEPARLLDSVRRELRRWSALPPSDERTYQLRNLQRLQREAHNALSRDTLRPLDAE